MNELAQMLRPGLALQITALKSKVKKMQGKMAKARKMLNRMSAMSTADPSFLQDSDTVMSDDDKFEAMMQRYKK